MATCRLPLPADGGGPILYHLWSMTRSVPTLDTSRVFVTHVFAPYERWTQLIRIWHDLGQTDSELTHS